MDYELIAAKARQRAMRERSGYTPPIKVKAPRKSYYVPKPKADLWKLAQAVMAEVGNCVPDGDPIDRLAPIIERMGFDRYSTNLYQLLDKACRKHLGCKSYNQYLIDAWDGWNEVCEPDQRMENPWK